MTAEGLFPCGSVHDVAAVRAAASRRAAELGWEDLSIDVALVVSELATNAVLHGAGCSGVSVAGVVDGVRVEVYDHSSVPPLLGHASESSLTGRGTRLVRDLASRWGAEQLHDGKVVWAELTGVRTTATDAAEVLAGWADDPGDHPDVVRAVLGDVPTSLLLAAKSHVDNLVREFVLLSVDEIEVEPLAPRLRRLLPAIERFSDARFAIKQQALAAHARGDPTTQLELVLPVEAAPTAEEYLAALDEIDAYCRAGRLLTLETPPQQKLFRAWYIGELVRQLRTRDVAAHAPPVPFQDRLLQEIDRLAEAQRAAERTSRLYAVASALALAATPEAVANAVLVEGVAALGAVAGGVLLVTDDEHLTLPGAVGYDDSVVARLRGESRHAELPAAVALRTGEPVWVESRAERDARFPELVGLERGTVSMCAIPLEIQGARLGAVRFSFDAERLFDEEERQFVLALAAQAAQALQRAQLQRRRFEAARDLEHSLMPPSLPATAWFEVAAFYHPFGEGLEVGGDFYDVWPIAEDQFAFAIGDTAGTGLLAAASSATVRHTARALITPEARLADVVRRLNKALVLHNGPASEQSCKALAGTIRPSGEGALLDVASGGHLPILVRRRDGTVEHHLVGGLPLGLSEDPQPETMSVVLRRGDAALLCSDGVVGARDDAGRTFGVGGLEAALVEADGDASGIASAVEAAVLGHTSSVLTDDMAALVLRIPRS